MPGKKRHIPSVNAAPLAQLIADRIRQEGPMSIADYVGMALGHPEHGYYISQENIIGAKGDFTTAPEISQMFGEMIGLWLVDAWLQSGKPENIKLIELGPGKGTLAADVLRTVSAWPEFKATMTLHLVETSPRLRQKQFEVLKAWQPTWYDRLEEIPVGPCFIISNEFFDALPVHQLEKTAHGWEERRIGWNEERQEFFFTTAPLSFDVTPLMPGDFLNAAEGSVFETSPVELSVLEEMCRRIAEYGGAGLIVDYGHVAPGLGDTLQAVSKHKYSNVLENPGLKDLTAHVDFGMFKMVAEQAVRVHGPVEQGEFLKSLGIIQRAETLCARATKNQRKDIDAALHRLTAPTAMGGLFKVMGLTPKGKAFNVSGFGEVETDHEEELDG
jgi:NADH dehydrogenase [ubiquinone] 1 alpha subcomplex assembly factor 7